jgi:hypothetical protein
VPNTSSASELCTFGPGVPARLTIAGAMIAMTIRTTMKASATIATLSRRSRRQNSCIGERAVIFCGPAASWTTTIWSSCSCMSPAGSPVLTGATSRFVLRK